MTAWGLSWLTSWLGWGSSTEGTAEVSDSAAATATVCDWTGIEISDEAAI